MEDLRIEQAAGTPLLRENPVQMSNYDVRIETLDLGYIVRVGCKSFAIQDKEVLTNMLTKYFNDPIELQQQFNNKTLTIK